MGWGDRDVSVIFELRFDSGGFFEDRFVSS